MSLGCRQFRGLWRHRRARWSSKIAYFRGDMLIPNRALHASSTRLHLCLQVSAREAPEAGWWKWVSRGGGGGEH